MTRHTLWILWHFYLAMRRKSNLILAASSIFPWSSRVELMTLVYQMVSPSRHEGLDVDLWWFMFISMAIPAWDVRDVRLSPGPSPWQPCHGTRPRWMCPAPVATGARHCTRSMAMEAAWGPKIWKSRESTNGRWLAKLDAILMVHKTRNWLIWTGKEGDTQTWHRQTYGCTYVPLRAHLLT